MIKRFVPHMLAACLTLVAASSVSALPADIEADRLVLAAEEKLGAQDYEAARGYLDRVDGLKVTPVPKFYYLSGQIAFHYGELSKASELLSQYVEEAGREGDAYEDALRKITQIEEQMQSQEAVSQSRDQLRDIKAASGIEREDTAGQAYDEKIRKLYIAPSLKDSLVLHINSLLSSYEYMEGRIKNRKTSERLEFQVSLQGTSQLSVARKQVKPANSGQSSISTSTIDAFGVNPFVSYRCSSAADQCQIKHPVTGAEWIVIAADESAAKELSTALTRLIKALQR
ncbi:hypothetical protein [Ketobacter alkanivorans]|uniref:Tetratricopeptide repeat protein n=1 Tax=Ketobacter alkanivorans TaxID=1917421 RepID=A0A2K9LRB8_9GAMM|nr:hypothetical protein [Ketobacter alkanivorans]AUM14005.1 hypothetical protein Kalk_16920 [Ketobacter alkanivorans]